jgi:hypothetical protein
MTARVSPVAHRRHRAPHLVAGRAPDRGRDGAERGWSRRPEAPLGRRPPPRPLRPPPRRWTAGFERTVHAGGLSSVRHRSGFSPSGRRERAVACPSREGQRTVCGDRAHPEPTSGPWMQIHGPTHFSRSLEEKAGKRADSELAWGDLRARGRAGWSTGRGRNGAFSGHSLGSLGKRDCSRERVRLTYRGQFDARG